jgi:hypothetical protein
MPHGGGPIKPSLGLWPSPLGAGGRLLGLQEQSCKIVGERHTRFLLLTLGEGCWNGLRTETCEPAPC